MKPHLQCAEQQVSRSNLTKYCACHAERLAYLVLITYETSFTMRGATGVTIQPHQILRLSRRKTHILSPHHIWNVIYNARSNRCHDPTSPNTAPVTNEMQHHLQCEEQQVSRSNLTKYCACHAERLAYLSSSHMKPHLQCAEQQVSRSNLTKYCACHAERLTYLVIITYETSFTMRGATGVTIQPHQIHAERLTYLIIIHMKRQCAANVTIQPYHCAATKNDWTALSSHKSFPMRGATGVTIQPHQILRLPRKMTLQDFKENLQKQVKRHFQCGADPSMIRPWSENETMIRPWKRKPQPASQVRLLFELTTSIFYWKIQRFAPNLTFKPSPNTAPATKSDTWTSPNTAPATKSDTWTSPSTAPATKSDTMNVTKYCACHNKWHPPTHQILRLPRKSDTQLSPIWNSFTVRGATGVTSNLTKYCACHEKWHCKISMKISKNRWNSFPTIRHDPTWLRLLLDENANRNPPRKWGYFSRSPEAFSIVKYNVSRPILHSNFTKYTATKSELSPNTAPATKSDTWTSPSTAPATKSDTWTSPSTAPATKSDTWTSPSTAPATDCNYSDSSTLLTLDLTNYSDEQVTLLSWQLLRLHDTDSTWLLLLYLKLLHWLCLRSNCDPTSTKYCTCHDKMTLLLDSTLLAPATKTLQDFKENLYLTLFYLTLLYLTLLYLTLLYSTWLHSTWATLLDTTLLDSTLLDTILLYLTLLYLTLLYLTPLYEKWLYSTWLYSTWLYYLLYLTLLYLTLLDSTWLYLTLLDSTLTLLDTTLLYSTWLYSTLLDSTWLYLTWLLYSTLLDYLTLLDSTWLYLTLLYLTLLWLWLYSTWLYSDSDTTLLDSTLLDSTWHYSTTWL